MKTELLKKIKTQRSELRKLVEQFNSTVDVNELMDLAFRITKVTNEIRTLASQLDER